jgi:hypothetical protein
MSGHNKLFFLMNFDVKARIDVYFNFQGKLVHRTHEKVNFPRTLVNYCAFCNRWLLVNTNITFLRR